MDESKKRKRENVGDEIENDTKKIKTDDKISDSESDDDSDTWYKYDDSWYEDNHIRYDGKSKNIGDEIERICKRSRYYYTNFYEDVDRFRYDFRYGKCLLCNYNYRSNEYFPYKSFSKEKHCYFPNCKFCSNEFGDDTCFENRGFICDHDHERRRFRGLICAVCNLREGKWKNNQTLIRCPIIKKNYQHYLKHPDIIRISLPEYSKDSIIFKIERNTLLLLGNLIASFINKSILKEY